MGRVYVRRPARKSPGGLRHTGDAPYRCFLPDLTRFGAPAAQDPGSSQRVSNANISQARRILIEMLSLLTPARAKRHISFRPTGTDDVLRSTARYAAATTSYARQKGGHQAGTPGSVITAW